MAARAVRVSFRKAQRLVPAHARGLRARSVMLSAGSVMPWHSTGSREELILVLAGRVRLETRPARGRVRAMDVRSGQGIFLTPQTTHQVVNRSAGRVRYVYVTAPVTGRR